MFVVIYKFKVNTGKMDQFKTAWTDLTKLIYQYEGSLGSRLHRENNDTFIAYAQWPNRKQWETSGDQLPPEAEPIRLSMKQACTSIETMHTLETEDDLLKTQPYHHGKE